MSADRFIARFWGARGSYPVPGEQTLRYGGNTTCLELQVGQHPLIIDAGTGIINLGQDLIRRARRENGTLAPIIATILLTHMHHDHTQGFPFFAPTYMGSSILHILGPRTFEQSLEDALKHVVMPPNFPLTLHEMPSLKIVRTLSANEVLVLDQEQGKLRIYDMYRSYTEQIPEDMMCVRILYSPAHPRSGVYIYRVEWHGKSVVFASDNEGYVHTNQRLIEFARDTDLLIHDAQYTDEEYIHRRQSFGHSTPEMACAVAHACGAKRLVLTHHNPSYDDHQIAEIERVAQACFPGALAAYEGLEIEL